VDGGKAMKARETKVLLVEDESSVRKGVKEWLTDDGYSVETVETGQQALERLKEEPYGVIVLDLKLPDIDGLQVFEEAKKIMPEVKGIIITAFPSRETHEKGANLGIIEYLPKPFKLDDLEKIISGALEGFENKKTDNKKLWPEIGALSYRICDLNYECGSCPLAQEIQDIYGTFVLIENKEVEKLKLKAGGQKFCRYGSVHIFPGQKTYLD
jgi:DNA-binding NtrC family response regulator